MGQSPSSGSHDRATAGEDEGIDGSDARYWSSKLYPYGDVDRILLDRPFLTGVDPPADRGTKYLVRIVKDHDDRIGLSTWSIGL